MKNKTTGSSRDPDAAVAFPSSLAQSHTTFLSFAAHQDAECYAARNSATRKSASDKNNKCLLYLNLLPRYPHCPTLSPWKTHVRTPSPSCREEGTTILLRPTSLDLDPSRLACQTHQCRPCRRPAVSPLLMATESHFRQCRPHCLAPRASSAVAEKATLPVSRLACIHLVECAVARNQRLSSTLASFFPFLFFDTNSHIEQHPDYWSQGLGKDIVCRVSQDSSRPASPQADTRSHTSTSDAF